MRLLLVEDDGMVGESVRTGLHREGFTVDWVKDGVAAELAAANDDYAFILLDLGLPRKDGIDVLKALRLLLALNIGVVGYLSCLVWQDKR
jgi:two-component system response regulator QseB